jgi:hypothetical protein
MRLISTINQWFYAIVRSFRPLTYEQYWKANYFTKEVI